MEIIAKVVERLLPDLLPRLPGIKCNQSENMTKQAHKNECDVNKIVERARITGGLDVALNDNRGIYSDVSNIRSFADVQNRLIAANDEFMRLPAKTRKLFDNKVINMVEYLEKIQDTEESIKEAVDLGLLPVSVLNAKRASDQAKRDALEQAKREAAAKAAAGTAQ